jgi:hypothetical protein
LTPSAYYWLGNAHYSLRDCKKAIEAHRVVVNKWPANAKAPDALLNMATCQQELADAKGARWKPWSPNIPTAHRPVPSSDGRRQAPARSSRGRRRSAGVRMTDLATLRVSEIFHSLQGESTRAGLPTVFVRLTGCPLRCAWCDTDYAF